MNLRQPSSILSPAARFGESAQFAREVEAMRAKRAANRLFIRCIIAAAILATAVGVLVGTFA